MKRLIVLFPGIVVLGVVLLATSASSVALKPPPLAIPPMPAAASIGPVLERVRGELQQLWEQAGIAPAEPAEELTVLRRLSLALHGTIPSLEEIRLFEADSRPDRLEIWTAAMLEDDRFSYYFAERLARACVGVEGGQFIIFRRDRFLDWLRRQLKDHVPYDQIVRDMIQKEGVWTGEGAVNFVTAGFADGKFDPNKLTARTTRAFLGQRIDCAQCHDHPFDHWKQAEFEGLAAYYGQVDIAPLGGVFEKQTKDLVIKDRLTQEDRTVSPSVPFHPEWLGQTGTRREQLARWVTHPDNQRFEIAMANRVWGLMFGRPFHMHRPVDDLPDPGTDPHLNVLEVLGRDFREHGCDLRRMIRVIAASEPFRMQSRHPLDREPSPEESAAELTERLEEVRRSWAVFPLIRLRPEQVIGAMLQANSVRTVDQNSHLFIRFRKFFRQRDFINDFGDPGVDELQDFSGTVPQALLRMNGEFAKELSQTGLFSSAGKISADAATPERIVETAFLVCLTRRPSDEERQFFLPWLTGSKSRRDRGVTDLYWALFNSPEFSWNG